MAAEPEGGKPVLNEQFAEAVKQLVPELKRLECGLTIFNPGSVALPKGGSARSFGYFDGESLSHISLATT